MDGALTWDGGGERGRGGGVMNGSVLLQVELGHSSEVSQSVRLAWVCLLQSFHGCDIWFGPEVITMNSDYSNFLACWQTNNRC